MLWVVPVKPWTTRTPMSFPSKAKGSAPSRTFAAVLPDLSCAIAAFATSPGARPPAVRKPTADRLLIVLFTVMLVLPALVVLVATTFRILANFFENEEHVKSFAAKRRRSAAVGNSPMAGPL